MCGILFAIGAYSKQSDGLKMCLDNLKQRGPDGQRHIKPNGREIYLGHTRLAIQDTSENAAQPMVSRCGRYSIIYNGELYNIKELHSLIPDWQSVLQTKSDTELILELYIRYDVKVLKFIRGMFTFIIWDDKSEEAFIARDPYGIKPLYFTESDSGTIFCSQIKAILQSGLVKPILSEKSTQYFQILGNLSADKTLFSNINVFPAGHMAKLANGSRVEPVRFADFDIDFSYSDKSLNENELNLIRCTLDDSIYRHMIGDVPIGIFLSNGIDSSVIAAALCNYPVDSSLGSKITSITMTFPEYKGTERDESRGVLDYYSGSVIHPVIHSYTKEEYCADIDRFFEEMDSPTIDGFNVWCTSKIAKKHNLKAVLSGVGGDELFAGYTHMRYLPLFQEVLSNPIMHWIVISCLRILNNFDTFSRPKLEQIIQLLEGESDVPIEILWLLKRAAVLSKLKTYEQCEEIFLPHLQAADLFRSKTMLNSSKVFALENHFYLKSQLLRDIDWASMAHGIEVRTPFVDYALFKDLKQYIPRLFKYKAKSPMYHKLKYFPHNITHRSKTGFNIPVREWSTEYYNRNQDSEAGQWVNLVYERYLSSLGISYP